MDREGKGWGDSIIRVGFPLYFIRYAIFKLQLILNFSCMLAKERANILCECTRAAGCLLHTFRLLSLNPEASKIEETQINLCPKTSGIFRSDNLYPEWQGDGLFYTPCFILGVDRHYNVQNRSFEFESFKKRVEIACSESRELEFPRPSQRNKYCGICKSSYEDYINHINSVDHIHNSREPQVNEYINDMMDIYPQPLRNKRKRVWKPLSLVEKKGTGNAQKMAFEGSTLATRKANKDEQVEGEKEKAARHKNIGKSKVSSRKMTLRNYKPN